MLSLTIIFATIYAHTASGSPTFVCTGQYQYPDACSASILSTGKGSYGVATGHYHQDDWTYRYYQCSNATNDCRSVWVATHEDDKPLTATTTGGSLKLVGTRQDGDGTPYLCLGDTGNIHQHNFSCTQIGSGDFSMGCTSPYALSPSGRYVAVITYLITPTFHNPIYVFDLVDIRNPKIIFNSSLPLSPNDNGSCDNSAVLFLNEDDVLFTIMDETAVLNIPTLRIDRIGLNFVIDISGGGDYMSVVSTCQNHFVVTEDSNQITAVISWDTKTRTISETLIGDVPRELDPEMEYLFSDDCSALYYFQVVQSSLPYLGRFDLKTGKSVHLTSKFQPYKMLLATSDSLLFATETQIFAWAPATNQTKVVFSLPNADYQFQLIGNQWGSSYYDGKIFAVTAAYWQDGNYPENFGLFSFPWPV